MKFLLILLVFGLSAMARAEWKPPEKPDPKQILGEAEQDAQAGRYADALAKHAWFHANALRYDKALYGVRLSFALSAWKRLALEYPPAMDALVEARDADNEAIRSDKFHDMGFHVFNELSAINKYLEDEENTTELFQWLDKNRPEAARQYARIAERALIKSKQYLLAGKYVDPDAEMATLLKGYQEQIKMSKEPAFGDRVRQMAESSFSKDSATLVALLVINGRPTDAEKIANKASQELDSPDMKALLKKARAGTLPGAD